MKYKIKASMKCRVIIKQTGQEFNFKKGINNIEIDELTLERLLSQSPLLTVDEKESESNEGIQGEDQTES